MIFLRNVFTQILLLISRRKCLEKNSDRVTRPILKTWPWLTYDIKQDVVFCHVCVKSLDTKKMTAKRADPAFVQKGFSYWKDATTSFKKHESSECHKEAVHVSVILPRACGDVGEMLSSQHAQQKEENSRCLLKIISNVKFLSRQGRLTATCYL